MHKFSLKRVAIGATALCAVAFGSFIFYHSDYGISLRAKLGQTSGTFYYAAARYAAGDYTNAITSIAPLVSAGHRPSLAMLCAVETQQEAIDQADIECLNGLESDPVSRLSKLTEIAIWAQEWDVAENLINQRLSENDISAHFDMARLVAVGPTGKFEDGKLAQALLESATATDPRGQYASVVATLNATADGSISAVLAEILQRRPKISAGDAYFELAKLMQTGVISSDLKYIEVLRRADADNNPHAARYLAQYYIANPDLDPTGAEKSLWIEKAADTGDAVAQYNWATELLQRQNEEGSLIKALDYLDKSAASGFVPAMNMLGVTLYQNPEMVEVLDSKVDPLDLLKMAAEKNDAHANFNLGNIYMSLSDKDSAIPYLEKAAELGNMHARQILNSFSKVEE